MPRKKTAQQEVDDATLPIIPGRSTRNRQTLLDPQAALPGAMKRVGPKPVQTEKQQNRADPKHLRQRFALYCKELAAKMGDPVPSLAVAFDITIEEARERQVELHTEITRAVNVMSTKELFDMNGISKQHRIMRLREMMYSDHPAVILKAMDMLNDYDGSNKSSGETWEEWAAMAMGKRPSS
jgi:hypothetical protein